MTPFDLINELKAAVSECLSDLRFKNWKGEWVPVSVHGYAIPIKEDDDPSEPFPYVEVRIVDGVSEQSSDATTIRTWLIIGIYDDADTRDGEKHVLGIFQRIIERFMKDSTLPHFVLTSKIDWTIENTNSYPYYYGGIEMTFSGHSIVSQNAQENIFT